MVRAGWENSRGDLAIRVEAISLNSLCLHYPLSILGRGRISRQIANALNYVGVLAVEIFVVQGNGGPKVLVNEIAPRVHNSGHWTLDGASISQFEQHIRAIAGWPLSKLVRHGPVTITKPGRRDINSYEQWLTVPGATVYLYGKGPPRPGRKMGHATQVGTIPPKSLIGAKSADLAS
jgi:5-(carboxyamino)imidazole ribonucleotide synthase